MASVAEEYWNGRTYIAVEDTTVLLNPTQELANSIATGPQDDLYSALDRFNRPLPDNVKLAVTPSWNWRPGTIPKFRDYLINTLYKLNKKSSGLEHLMRRTREYTRMYQYWERNLRELESLKFSLKDQGYSLNVDIEEFRERLTKIITKLEKEADLVREMTQDNTTIKILVSGMDNPRYAKLYIDIITTDLTMSIFQHSKLLHKAPLAPIHILFNVDLRKYINNQDKKNPNFNCIGPTGMYLSRELDNNNNRLTQETFFPYIAIGGRERYTNNLYYGTVCLDKYNDEVKTSIIKGNLVNAIMSIMSWAQYYNTDFSHPYNNLKSLQIGMPGSFSKEYAAITGHDSNCGNILYDKYKTSFALRSEKDIVNTQKMHSFCKSIECQFAGVCNAYQGQEMTVQNMDNEEHKCMVEGFIGHLMTNEISVDEKYLLLDYYPLDCSIQDPTEIILNNLYWVMIATSPLTFKEVFRLYNPVEQVNETLTEEEQREAVMRFATGSR